LIKYSSFFQSCYDLAGSLKGVDKHLDIKIVSPIGLNTFSKWTITQ